MNRLLKKINKENYVNICDTKDKTIVASSESYGLSSYPKAIYIWVGERSSSRYNSPERFTRIDSYARIEKISISLGNKSHILFNFDINEFFLMSLRNGLQDRTLLDWGAGPKSITTPTDYYGNTRYLGVAGDIPYARVAVGDKELSYDTIDHTKLPAFNRYAGIGSVVKLIPGIDITSGDGANPIVAEMRENGISFKFDVKFVPLNVHEDIDYSLFIMYEYDNKCVIDNNGMRDHKTFLDKEEFEKAPK